jgi:hypothetical protein
VDAAAVAIYSIDRMGKTEYFQIATVPGGQSVTLTVTRVPRGTVRVIIEVDPLIVANSAPVEVLVIQGAFGVSHLGPGPFRMVLDVI